MVRVDRFLEVKEREENSEDGSGFNVVHTSIEVYEWDEYNQIVHNLELMGTNAKINGQRADVAHKDLKAMEEKVKVYFEKAKIKRDKELAEALEKEKAKVEEAK